MRKLVTVALLATSLAVPAGVAHATPAASATAAAPTAAAQIWHLVGYYSSSHLCNLAGAAGQLGGSWKRFKCPGNGSSWLLMVQYS